MQMSMFDLMYEECKVDKPIRLIELFAGYGSQSLALRNIGAKFETYRVVEFDKYAIASYNAIHGTDFPTIDIKDVKGIDLGITDKERFTYLLTYSFPCTDISLAGRMAGMAKDSGTRSSLLWEVERILLELKETDSLPQILMMENVTEIHGTKNLKHFQEWTTFLKELGYSNYTQDLNTADYGLPHHRERCFMISLLGDYTYNFPTEIEELTTCMEDYFQELTEEEALKQIVKSEKAMELLVELDEKDELT